MTTGEKYLIRKENGEVEGVATLRETYDGHTWLVEFDKETGVLYRRPVFSEDLVKP